MARLVVAWCLVGVVAASSSPPGPGPWGSEVLRQPVAGAARCATADGWRAGKVCDVAKDYGARPGLSASSAAANTKAVQAAIDDCGDRAGGGTVLVRSGIALRLGSIFLRSNLTLRVEANASLVGSQEVGDYERVYTRREAVMTEAFAGLVNGGRCARLKEPRVGWDDCAEWATLENVCLEGGGTIDGDGAFWFDLAASRERSMMLDLLWVRGLTVRDLELRRPGFWTVHPTFCDDVRVVGNTIVTRREAGYAGRNTDGCDPDSSWNVYVALNTFETGDDCVAIKSGRGWSGRMVNVSTRNVLLERNAFRAGHGVSIGSETGGWITNVTVRDSTLEGTNVAVRLKSARTRGGGIQGVLYSNLSGTANAAVQISLAYEHDEPPTNASATPAIRDVRVSDLDVDVSEGTKDAFLTCVGLNDSAIRGVAFDRVRVRGSKDATCAYCSGTAIEAAPEPCFAPSSY